MKRLLAVVFGAVVLSCLGIGILSAFGGESFEPDDASRLPDASTDHEFPAPNLFSVDPDDWNIVIVGQDSVSSVLVRLYGKISADFTIPEEVFAQISGLDSPRTWIGDANGNPYKESAPFDEYYIIIEGTAQSEDEAKNSHIDWIGYRVDSRTIIQDFSENPVTIGAMPNAGRGAGGCDSGVGSFALALTGCGLYAAYKKIKL
jgi:hypothetical protein